MLNDTLQVLYQLFQKGDSTLNNPAEMAVFVARSLQNEDRDIILQAIRLKIPTLINTTVKSPNDTFAINLIKDKLSITWKQELVDKIVNLFIQAKFNTQNDDQNFKVKNTTLLNFDGKNTVVKIPKEIIIIGNNAFAWCHHIESVDLSENIKTIGDWAFATCGIHSLTIPKSLTKIGNWAFTSCTNLNTIQFSTGLKTIGSFAFSWCSSLSFIELPEGLSSIECKTFERCVSLYSITIPSTVTTIHDEAFTGCSSLSSIIIPEGVVTIGKGVFSKCPNLTEIQLPSTLKSIANLKISSTSNNIINNGKIWSLLTDPLIKPRT